MCGSTRILCSHFTCFVCLFGASSENITSFGHPFGFVEQDVTEAQLAARLADPDTWVPQDQIAAQFESTPLQAGIL